MCQKLMNFISANALFLLAICCCALISAETLTPKNIQQEQKIKEFSSNGNQKRIKRQFGGSGFGGGFSGGGDNGNFNGFGGNFNGNFGGQQRGQRPRPNNGNQFFPNNNNFASPGLDGGGFGSSGSNNQLIFSNNQNRSPTNNAPNGGNFAPAVTTPATFVSNGLDGSNNVDGNPGQLVFINNRPTIATMAPFTGRTTPSPQFMTCFNSCATTSEYNPICGSDLEQYFNEQKFNCARRCGADIQIVRRGSCMGLFPMMRG